MSEETESAGAPVAETASSDTEVLAAVERASDPAQLAPAAAPVSAAPAPEFQPTSVAPQLPQPAPSFATESQPELRPEIPAVTELPSAGPPAASPVLPPEDLAQQAPATAPYGAPYDGEIRTSRADHPMAALYMQTPMPPDLRGNRGAGVLISLLATAAFALVYAGVIAVLLAPQLPPSQFFGGLVGVLLSWPAILATCAFFVGLTVVVLVVGRAGWWAYVLGGFLVAMFVWVAAIAGVIIADRGLAGLTRIKLDDLANIALIPYILVAVLVAREVTVWFGAWIGARGRKVTRANAEALTEYEAALAEVQAKQP